MVKKRTQASELDVGKLHAKVVRIFGMGLDQMIEKLEEGEEAAFCVDPKLLSIVIKFLTDNKCFTVADEQDAENPLAKKLAEIRSRQSIVPLVKEA